MSDDSLHEQIEAATGYEELLVPALFQQWSDRVLEAAQIRPGARILDVACGTGVLAREAVARTSFLRVGAGPSGRGQRRMV